MKAIVRIFYSKKVIVSLTGMIMALLVANGIIVPPGFEELLLKLIAAIVAAFNVGQGIADGISRGRTSLIGRKSTHDD